MTRSRTDAPGTKLAAFVARACIRAVVLAAAFACTGCPEGNSVTEDGGSADVLLPDVQPHPNYTEWTFSAGGKWWDWASTVAVSKNDSVIFGGTLSGVVEFGSMSINAVHLRQPFVAELDSLGEVKWVLVGRTGGGDGFLSELALDGDGNAVVCGSFDGQLDLGGLKLTSTGGTDFFVAKLGPGGKTQWAISGGEHDMDIPLGLATLGDGAVVVSGGGFDVHHGQKMVNVGMFLRRLTSGGKLEWIADGGGPAGAFAGAVAVGNGDSIHVTGTFGVNGKLDARFGTTTLVSSGHTDVFIAKLKPTGEYLWARAAGGKGGNDSAGSLSVCSDGTAYVSGGYRSIKPSGASARFGSTTLAAHGAQDGFVAKVDSSGNFVWARGFGSERSEGAAGVVCDPKGNAIFTGDFHGDVSFGTHVVSSRGELDMSADPLERHQTA